MAHRGRAALGNARCSGGRDGSDDAGGGSRLRVGDSASSSSSSSGALGARERPDAKPHRPRAAAASSVEGEGGHGGRRIDGHSAALRDGLPPRCPAEPPPPPFPPAVPPAQPTASSPPLLTRPSLPACGGVGVGGSSGGAVQPSQAFSLVRSLLHVDDDDDDEAAAAAESGVPPPLFPPLPVLAPRFGSTDQAAPHGIGRRPSPSENRLSGAGTMSRWILDSEGSGDGGGGGAQGGAVAPFGAPASAAMGLSQSAAGVGGRPTVEAGQQQQPVLPPLPPPVAEMRCDLPLPAGAAPKTKPSIRDLINRHKAG